MSIYSKDQSASPFTHTGLPTEEVGESARLEAFLKTNGFPTFAESAQPTSTPLKPKPWERDCSALAPADAIPAIPPVTPANPALMAAQPDPLSKKSFSILPSMESLKKSGKNLGIALVAGLITCFSLYFLKKSTASGVTFTASLGGLAFCSTTVGLYSLSEATGIDIVPPIRKAGTAASKACTAMSQTVKQHKKTIAAICATLFLSFTALVIYTFVTPNLPPALDGFKQAMIQVKNVLSNPQNLKILGAVTTVGIYLSLCYKFKQNPLTPLFKILKAPIVAGKVAMRNPKTTAAICTTLFLGFAGLVTYTFLTPNLPSALDGFKASMQQVYDAISSRAGWITIASIATVGVLFRAFISWDQHQYKIQSGELEDSSWISS